MENYSKKKLRRWFWSLEYIVFSELVKGYFFSIEANGDSSKQFFSMFFLWIWTMNTPLSVVKKSAYLIKRWRRYSIFFGIVTLGSSSIISYRAEKQSQRKSYAHVVIHQLALQWWELQERKYFFIMISLPTCIISYRMERDRTNGNN